MRPGMLTRKPAAAVPPSPKPAAQPALTNTGRYGEPIGYVNPKTGLRKTGCGTNAGYQQHRYNGTPPCPECQAANRQYHRNYYRRNRQQDPDNPPKKRSPVRCGTAAGYQRHLRNRTPTCRPCKDAWAEHQRPYSAAKRRRRGQPERKPPACPSHSRHVVFRREHGRDCCPDCRAAANEYARNRYRQRKQETAAAGE